MAQEYTIRTFTKGDFQDNHGNWWCTAIFEGEGEPIKMVVKDPTKFEEGMTVYGDITEQTSKAGNTYLRFKRQQQDGQQSHTEAPGRDNEYWDEKDKAIRAQFAIKSAVSAMGEFPGREEGDSSDHATYIDNVEFLAIEFFNMVERVKADPRKAQTTDPEKDRAEEEYNNETFGYPEGEYHE